MANEAPAAVDHADSDAMSVEPLSPMVSNAAVPEEELQALQMPPAHLVNTSCLANKQQAHSLDEEESVCPTTQPAGPALHVPQLPQLDNFTTSPAMPPRQPPPSIRSPAVPSRHAAPASTGAVHGQQASRRPGPAHCDADELWAAWHWGQGALQGVSAPNMAQCAFQPSHAPKKR